MEIRLRDAMTSGVHGARRALAALALALILSAAPALAQQPGTAGPPGPSGSNPTAMSVTEEQLLQEFNKLRGRVTVPDQQAGMLQQPQGRDYRAFHERILPWIAAIFIIGMLIALAAFYFSRGRIRMQADDVSGRKIQRFNAFERFTHWMTATCFIVLAITGLNYFLGKRLLMPLLGPDAFAAWSQWAKYAHNFVSWPFMLGVVFMAVVWLRDNLPDRYDAAWLKAGGGFFGGRQPVAGRFNAGQKLIFWSVVLFGVVLSATGIVMLFPFWALDINGMQVAQYVHSTAGVLLIAIIIAHIYIGTLGMEGAYEAMWSGQVDVGWARHHHRAWFEAQQAPAQPAPARQLFRRRGSAPAE
jgi:formate dehydrogenase subunit gamma